ncbi:MAG: SpoIIE family protein phosphatase [Desulfobacterales bacterium]|nr:SpoIIE family protein phosphatase [Desulfobacterales bacterium]
MQASAYDKAVKISEHVYWVGTYDPSDKFQCNSYLIVIDGKGVIIDPGSTLYLENLIRKLSELVDLKDISHIIIQHQDPDVAGNIVMLMDTIRARGNEMCKIITHKRTSALIRHYGGDLKFEYSNELPGQKLTLGVGSILEFIHTPYLHAPGAIATYFSRDKMLFSGDIFGGMIDKWDLFAGKNYFEEITSFHEDYMPAKELLLYAMTKFERYDIEMIAPQHGSVLNKKQAKTMIDKFKDFECGLFIDQAFREELYAARKRIEEQNKIMSEELSLAGHFQRTLLPDKSATEWDTRIDIGFLFQPCSQVSGDFLIIDRIDEHHLGVMVTDVVGHGVMPGLATIQVKTLFDEHKRESLSPGIVLRTINERSFSVSENDIFLTALYVVYDLDRSTVTIASAGGIPPIYYSARQGEGKLIALAGTPLGMCEGRECQITEDSFSVGKDDFLIVQTDGLIECFNNRNEPFERLKSQRKFMEEINKERSSQEVLDAIMEKVNRHKGEDKEFDDDVTIAVIKKR